MAEDQIDPVISSWVLEFLLHQPIEDRVLIPLARVLPISENNFVIKKLFLFRRLESEVSKSIISEKPLEILHQIDELDQRLGIKNYSEYLKKAYCAIAIECTVRCLRNSNNDVKGEYFDMVKMIWRGWVREMEGKNTGLLSEELLKWKLDIETAVWEENVCLKVVERSEEIDAAEAVLRYLEAEKARMRPSFLELVKETLKSKEGVIPGSICLKKDDIDQCRINGGQEPEYDNNDITYDKRKTVPAVMEKSNSLSRRKHVARKRSRKVTCPSSRGAKITDLDESGAGPSCNSQLLGTPEVKKVQEALESSRLELHAVVKDPLPEALRLAESVKSVSSIANKDLEPPGGQSRGKSAVDNVQNAQSDEANVGVENMDFEPPGDRDRNKYSGVGNALDVKSGEQNAGCSGQSNPKKSLMERNKTVVTFEWADSINRSSDEELSDSSSRPHLPSPRGMRVSPLNIYKPKLKKQRKKKRWSTAEEDALRAGVEKFGKGHWKLILNTFRDIFEERTEVDLKDKWRNMTRFN